MEFTILDSQSTNIVRLGDDRTRVRDILGPYRVFRRGGEPDYETDHFLESGPMVTYAEDRVIVLELVEPSSVFLQGVQLLGETLDALEPRLAEVGVHLERDDLAAYGPQILGAAIPEYEILLYVPYDIVEGVQLGNG